MVKAQRQSLHSATWPWRKSLQGQIRWCLALTPAQLNSSGSFCWKHSLLSTCTAGNTWFFSASKDSHRALSLKCTFPHTMHPLETTTDRNKFKTAQWIENNDCSFLQRSWLRHHRDLRSVSFKPNHPAVRWITHYTFWLKQNITWNCLSHEAL